MFVLRKDIDKFSDEYKKQQATEGMGDMSVGYLPEFNCVVDTVIEDLTRLFEHKPCTSDMISGWRHGYSAAAVARFILSERVMQRSEIFLGCNQYQEWALDQLRAVMRLNSWGWGMGYHYCPSVDELALPPAVVQADINRRLAEIRKLSIKSALIQDAFYIFNDPIPNASVVKHETEVEVITEFLHQVRHEMELLVSLAFNRTEA